MPTALDIRLRSTVPADIALLYAFQLDPRSNEMAGTKPRDRETFFAHWDKVLVNPEVVAAGGTKIGLSCHRDRPCDLGALSHVGRCLHRGVAQSSHASVARAEESHHLAQHRCHPPEVAEQALEWRTS